MRHLLEIEKNIILSEFGAKIDFFNLEKVQSSVVVWEMPLVNMLLGVDI